jgi:regulator of protease activity HflC (stomatin/prohibitin superfamily)
MTTFLGIVVLLVIIGLSVWKVMWENQEKERSRRTEREPIPFPLPKGLRIGLTMLMLVLIGFGTFNKIFFYAEPGYVYHVRTILGQEKAVDDVGYNVYLFGRKNAWKKAMSVVIDNVTANGVNAEEESSSASASLPPQNIMFLDQVDADADATVRFRLPSDEETFLKMAREYRTPENLLRVALIPAVQETIQATASLMSAEEYYSGGRTEFISEFENQMQNGIYLVKRTEIADQSVKRTTSEADASDPEDQETFGDQNKVVFVVKKQYDDETGLERRKVQKFTEYGIQVHEARVTDMRPNDKFVERMQLKQKASADRAIAREQRIQEEEQRLLAVAKGDREVAERQAAMKVDQIERTTKAETEKKEVLIAADRQKEQAEVEKQTSQILLEKARIDAEAVRVAAEAEAYKKQQILQADNALAQKLEAEIAIQRVWAEAYAKRQVPTTVFGGGGESGVPVGGDNEVQNFMKILTVDAANRLNYNRSLETAEKE